VVEAITMAGQAIFSNIKTSGQSYDYHVKRFRTLLKKQGAKQNVCIGPLGEMINTGKITIDDLRRIFCYNQKFDPQDPYYYHAEITIFIWE